MSASSTSVPHQYDDDEDEDVDFNPFLTETISSSLSSQLDDLDTDLADTDSHNNHLDINIHHATPNLQPAQLTLMLSSAHLSENESGGSLLHGSNHTGIASLIHVTDTTQTMKSIVDLDSEGAICMRTRARYSLASFTLDELETFLQETDDEDDLQNVDDEEEYRKFLAAVLRGDDSENLQGNANADDEDEENDADFELELEEALESEPDDVEERRVTRRNRRQKPLLERGNKLLGQPNRPLRPLVPFASIGSFPPFDGKHVTLSTAPTYTPPVDNGLTCGFTPHQIGQLHCLIHEHVQLLVQVFSVCVLEPLQRHIAAQVKELILEMLRRRDQVVEWRTLPYPSFCFFPPYVHSSVPDELHKTSPPKGSDKIVQQEFPSESNKELHAMSNGKHKHLPDRQTGSLQTPECTSWVPYISGPVLSVVDVAPLRLVKNYIDDVSSAVQAYERRQIEHSFEALNQREPLFPRQNSPCSTESDGQGEMENAPRSSHQMSKKTMAAALLEKAKNQSVAIVPKEIAKLAQRFWPLFNPALYPHRPPPAPLANRVLFTDAEDELLAMGLMEYNTDWRAIQQRFLPCKSKHQIFVRQKNRASSKAPENPIKAVRRIKNSPLTPEETARIEVGLKKYKLDWISIWKFFVPYRDPSLLPRQWRIACGTQKSYKSDANKKAKRRLYELRRRTSKLSPSNLHSSCEKEGDSTDNAIEDTNSGDNYMEKEDEAYVHEAFLADWRPDNNVSSNCPTHLLSQEGSQTREMKDNSGSEHIQSQMHSKSQAALRSSSSEVILRPYRARRTNSARLVKLAPNLPPVNLPPSVRVMSQSAFKSSRTEAPTKVSGNVSGTGGIMAENGTTKSGFDYSVKSGQVMSNCVKNTTSIQHPKYSEVLIDKCVSERGDSDLQMHPLLFQAPQDGSLPYYPLNCSTSTSSSFTFRPGKQPQLSLSLFHNPRHIRDAVNFLSKSSKPPEKNTSSQTVDFHPLLQRTDDVDTDSIAAHSSARMPSGIKPTQRCNSTASGSKVGGHNRKVNELDLDIHLNFSSKNQEAAENRNMRGRSGSAPLSGTIDSGSADDSSRKGDSTPDGISKKLDSGDFAMVTSGERESSKVIDNMCDESLPEIIMEQEELSDSDEEFGENVEFEHEEMADSDGDSTSDSEQFVDEPNEEVQLDETDADSDNHRVLNFQSDYGGNTCSMSDGHSIRLDSAEKGVDNIKLVESLNLNSCPPVSPHSNLKNGATGYEFGPFGRKGTFVQNQLAASSEKSRGDLKTNTGLVQKRSEDPPDHPRKRACRSSFKSNIAAVTGQGNASSDVDMTVENLKNVNTDEFG